MQFDVITLFPNTFQGFLEESIIKRAQAKELVKINLHNLRDYTKDKHKKVDDKPFGGGPGMVLMAEPIVLAIEFLEKKLGKKTHKVLLTPTGKLFNQSKASELASKENIIILCGHYEGFDERIKDLIEFDEISIGEYVLSGGEVPAMLIIDAVSRLIPGVLGNPLSAAEESFVDEGKLDFPQYTLPRVFRDIPVPPVLLSGNHEAIKKWRESAREKDK